MTEYNETAIFGNLVFNIAPIEASSQHATLKQNQGKSFIEKRIPLKNATDIILQINGVLTGLSATQGDDKAEVIQTERDTLEALQDGDKHAWDDGKHTGIDMAILPGSLRFPDDPNRQQGQPILFSMRLVQWQ